MTATVSDIIRIIEDIAPPQYAEKGDNVGLQIGEKGWTAKKIWVSLDPSLKVVANACAQNVDLLISHHPLLFNPVTSIDFCTQIGKIIQSAANHRLSIYAAHTNLDRAKGGVNDVLAARVGLKNIQLLEETPFDNRLYPLYSPQSPVGLGRIGELEQSMPIKSFLRTIKRNFGLKHVRVAGSCRLSVKRVAVCGGSGSSLLNTFMKSDAQVFISGDLRYHDARSVEDTNKCLVDIGHFHSERLVIESLAEIISKKLTEAGFDSNVEGCELETDPFIVL